MRQKNIDKFYSKALEEIKATYQESKSWDKVFKEYSHAGGQVIDCEALIDYVEEVCKTKFKDIEQLKEAIKVYPTGANLERLEAILNSAKQGRYERALKTAINEGAKYNELLKIDPKDFNLPETWGSFYNRPANKENSILQAIADEFLLMETIIIHPDLRDIAEELEAPYSIIMEAKNMVDFRLI
jgi:hypothetical protein